MNIVLDPSLIWFSPDSEDDFQYLCDVVDFIDLYLDIQYFVSTRFLELLYRMTKDPMAGYREKEQRKADIISAIWRGIDTDNIQDLTLYSPSRMPDGFQFPERLDIKEYICEILGFAEKEQCELLLFLATKNHKIQDLGYPSIKLVKHIYKELESYIALLFSSGRNIKSGCLISPTYENPLPNEKLCKAYTQLRLELIRAGRGDISNFKMIGREVAYRNGYEFDDFLTKINNEAIRDIYRASSHPQVILSTDTEHGAFEAFDENGNHLGEFSYEGKKTQKASGIDHKIKLKR